MIKLLIFIVFVSISVRGDEGQKTSNTLLQLKESALKGEPDSQYKLGLRYANGDGVALDMEKAFYWYEKAAKQGVTKAQNNLGVMYQNGKGCLKDPIEAIFWYKKAALKGDLHSQYNLGWLYANITGEKKDLNKAAYWIEKAHNGGLDRAKACWDKFELWKYKKRGVKK